MNGQLVLTEVFINILFSNKIQIKTKTSKTFKDGKRAVPVFVFQRKLSYF